MVGRMSGQYSVALGRAIEGPDGEPRGVVAASVLLTQLRSMLGPADLPPSAVVTLQDANGTVLARTLNAEHWIGRNLSDLAVTRTARDSREGVLEVPAPDGVPRLAGYARPSRVPWLVYVGIPSAVALAAVHDQERTARILGVASLVLSLVLAWLLARGIAEPVRALIADADAFASGDLAHRSSVHSLGELGALASTFNRMADALQRRRDQLSASEARYRSMFDMLPLPMWVFDLHSLRILEVNEAAIQRYGYSREEFLAMTIVDLRPPEDEPRLLESLGEAARGPVHDVGFRHLTKRGALLDVEINAEVVTFNGRPARLVVVNDVTERIHTERALHTSQEQLRQSQKMEAIGSLAGGIAHDFNNLLTAILGYCDLALTELAADSTASADVAEVRRAAQRAAELTRQLLAFSRRQVLNPRVFPLGEALRQMEKILRRLINEDITLELSLEDDGPLVRADPTQLEQVILNLAVNARDAMPRGGRLRLSTGTVAFERPFVTTGFTLPAGTYATLTVADTGSGIDPSIRERVFEPFFTTKARGQGTGLGLATVYGIMQQSGGAIEVAGRPGNGATFVLYFPIASQSGEQPDEVPPRREAEAEARGEGTILLAEDDDAVRAIMRETLQRAGYRVLAAADGAAALALADAHDGPIDLLLTDVIMPVMNGRELATILTARRPGICVLFASGYTDNVLAGQDVPAPGARLLNKPFTPAVLVASVREVLEGTHAA
jgi:PAS domain S-box-containing protein